MSGRPAGLAAGELEVGVQVALGRGQQAAVELLAQQPGLLAGPVGGQQHVGELRVAQQQAAVVVDQQDAQQEGASSSMSPAASARSSSSTGW
jgi:nucleoid-associated protein YgaU